ncbi:Protein of unknown function [Gryllus bimaculatus]|nr:Protein of unknown function [Gryllus bimaculatus]
MDAGEPERSSCQMIITQTCWMGHMTCERAGQGSSGTHRSSQKVCERIPRHVRLGNGLLKYIDSDGNLVEPDIEEHIKQTVISKDTLWSVGIVDKSIKKCLKEAKATDLPKGTTKIICNVRCSSNGVCAGGSAEA